MSDLYDRIKDLAEKNHTSVNQLRIKAGLSASVLNELKQGRTKDLSRKTAQKIADALGISVEELYEDKDTEKRKVTKEELKFALFNGNQEITDDMLNEVLNFAEWVQQREDNKNNS